VGGEIMEMKTPAQDDGKIVREILDYAPDEDREREILETIGALEGFRTLDVIDCTFLRHTGGKIEVVSKIPMANRDDLAMAYTPGVARISRCFGGYRTSL
jgi:malate dehydrogenase (oxaloacetate-decarboxylating)